MRRLLRSLARDNATLASIKTLSTDMDGAGRNDLSEKDITISRYTVVKYINNLMDIFVIEEIPPWYPEIRLKAIMRQAVKRIFIDPSLAIAALSVNRARLLNDLQTFGFMFENLCLRDLAVYSEYYGGKIFHYHNNSELEVDAIVEMPDGSWGAFEIKLGEIHVTKAAATLLKLKEKMLAAGAERPACLAVITGGGVARLRDDGVYVLPINILRH